MIFNDDNDNYNNELTEKLNLNVQPIDDYKFQNII